MRPSLSMRLIALFFLTASAQIEEFEPGPCDMNNPESVCRDVVDSSGCWNGVVGANGSGTAGEADANKLWKCVEGGKDVMCQCYGCDRGLNIYFQRNKLCAAP
ncbi:hypothetical protein B0T17DRAFT_511755 [Bombardia bombarda]|uniref:Uncharacterized protein n=1 Tax=Bombardia bombarda TaxID=252184 RepID=A0AA39U516_9PEZI|nr:hypothetical protein B0T17DRAFT_511755 [Bombardia bombarda]